MQQPKPNVIIRNFNRNEDYHQVMEVAKMLPEWFTPGGIRSMQADLQFQNGFVAILDERIVGFISYFVNQGKGEIGWMGVLPNDQRRGVGRKLLMRLVLELQKAQINELFVHTLGDTVEYEPYQKTRAFYRRVGFKDFKRILQPENPECEEDLILVLKLNNIQGIIE